MQIIWFKNASKFKWQYFKTYYTKINECVGGEFGMPNPQTAMEQLSLPCAKLSADA